MAAERRLDLFKTLGALDSRSQEYYAGLTDEEKKEIQPFLLLRWMSGTPLAVQIYLLNEYVNPYAFSLTKHKQLLWQLLTIASYGKPQRYTWNKLPSKRETGKPNTIRVIREYHGYSMSEAVDALPLLKRDDILSMAEDLGWQADDVTKVRRELKVEKAAKAASSEPTPSTVINDSIEY